MRLEMVTPKDYVGNLMELATGRRGAGAPWCTLRRCRFAASAIALRFQAAALLP